MKPGLSSRVLCAFVPVFLSSIGICFASGRSAMAEDKERLAVLPFVIEGLSTSQNRQLQQQFELRFRESPHFDVLSESVIKNLLADAGLTSIDSCTSLPCIAQLGKVLNAEKVVHVQGMHAGQRYAIEIRLVNASDAKLLYNESISYSGEFNNLLADALGQHAEKIANTHVTTAAPWYYYAAAVLVGGGLIYWLFSTWTTSSGSDSDNSSSSSTSK